jgi:hypothetical protein
MIVGLGKRLNVFYLKNPGADLSRRNRVFTLRSATLVWPASQSARVFAEPRMSLPTLNVSRDGEFPMASRTPHRRKKASAEKPEFTFHLVYKKPTHGPSATIGGAIVAGPVETLFSEALGAALGEMEANDTPSKLSPPKSADDSQKLSGKPKPKRRGRSGFRQ